MNSFVSEDNRLATYVLGLQFIAGSVSKEEQFKANPLDGSAHSTGIDLAVTRPNMAQQRKAIQKLKKWLERSDIPNPLPHINTNLCWCDPLIKLNEEDGGLVLIHKEVTWN